MTSPDQGQITSDSQTQSLPVVTIRRVFFQQSTYEQSPSTSISNIIWFKNEDTANYATPDHDNYNPLLSFLNWAKIPYENKLHNFNIHTFYQQQHRLPKIMPPEPRENVETIKKTVPEIWDGTKNISQTIHSWKNFTV